MEKPASDSHDIRRDSARRMSNMSASSSSSQKVDTSQKLDFLFFYGNYHGHRVGELRRLHKILKQKAGKSRFIYFVGDSTLDKAC